MKLVAIGGGEIDKYEIPSNLVSIDKEIISLANKTNPKLLFIPTASNDYSEYIFGVNKYFGDKFNCQVDSLELISKENTPELIKDKILNSDIIYVGGGSTANLIKKWNEINLQALLKIAFDKNIIVSGISAGANCWFDSGMSDMRKNEGVEEDFNYQEIKCLGFFDFVLCPHFNNDDNKRHRYESFKDILKKNNKIGIALDECCAIEIIDNKYKIISSQKDRNAYLAYWKNSKFIINQIPQTDDYYDLTDLKNGK